MSALIALLGLSDLMLATVVFVLIARPDSASEVSAWLTGDLDAWRHGGSDPALDARLRRLGRALGWLGLFGVAGWSFMVGALITWLRL